MVFPTAGRVVYAFFVAFWAVALSVYWELEAIYAIAFIAYAIAIGAYAIFYRSIASDLLTYKLYCVSESMHAYE